MNKIEVNGLTFSYEKRASSSRKNVLTGLNFTAEDGESIGLIGANGAGRAQNRRNPGRESVPGRYSEEDGICVSGFRQPAVYVYCV